MASQQPTYIDIVKRKQAEQQSRIPKEWRLSSLPDDSVTDVRGIPKECGILSPREIEITETYDAVDLADKIRRRVYSCYEVTLAFCKRAAIAQQLLNCLTEIFFDEALERAKLLDDHLKQHGLPVGPLHGVPISIKDSYNIPGYDSTSGVVALCFRPAKEKSSIVTVLENAGAVFYCKTNIPQTMMSLDSVNHIWGRVANPMNRKLTAGGSSGGEGALIGIRGSLLGIGSDIGGSIRVPAMCNGIYGVKPTSSRIASNVGTELTIPGSFGVGLSFSTGPLATSLRSCELLLKVVADGKLWECEPHVVHSPWRSLEFKPRQMKFLILMTDLVTTPLPPIQRVLKETAAQLQSRGHKVVVLDNPPKFVKQLHGLSNKLMNIEGGHGASDLLDATGEPKVPWIAPRLKRRDPSTLKELYGLNARYEQLTVESLKLWKSGDGQDIDAIICPVAPHPTPRPDDWNGAGYTSMFNMLDWPSGSIPARNVTREDLEAPLGVETGTSWDKINRTKLWEIKEVYLGNPLSLQVVGRKLQEEELLQAMHVVDEAVAPTRGAAIRDHKL
ncbi:Acetamidase [Dactylella cylindrospora]|nr:Acetamidase [Dactylella cylindrospora]